jgi:hypothetical protein
MSEAPVCFWCHRPFRTRRTGGRSQRFCRPSCRRALHTATRSWALNAIESGALTVADIRSGLPATRALRVPKKEPSLVDGRSGIVQLNLTVLQGAVADLDSLGWLRGAARWNDAVADAVVELVERAIRLGLRPS